MAFNSIILVRYRSQINLNIVTIPDTLWHAGSKPTVHHKKGNFQHVSVSEAKFHGQKHSLENTFKLLDKCKNLKCSGNKPELVQRYTTCIAQYNDKCSLCKYVQFISKTYKLPKIDLFIASFNQYITSSDEISLCS